MSKAQAAEDKEAMRSSKTGTSDAPDESTKVGAVLNNQGMEMGLLSAAHVGGSEYRILSTRNGTVTAYEVDIEEMACNCKDYAFNREGQEVCAHLAKALLVHTAHYSASEWAIRDIQTLTDRATQLTRHLQDTVEWVDTVVDSEAAHAASEDVAEKTKQALDDPVALAESWLESNGIDPEGVKVWIDDEYGSLQMKTDGLEDDEYGAFVDLCKENDRINWDGRSYQNFVKKDDIGRVFG